MRLKYELSEKEIYLVWSIICWFNRPVTSSLKNKFSLLAYSPNRKKYEEKYDKLIIKRIIELGEWLSKRYPEIMED